MSRLPTQNSCYRRSGRPSTGRTRQGPLPVPQDSDTEGQAKGNAPGTPFSAIFRKEMAGDAPRRTRALVIDWK